MKNLKSAVPALYVLLLVFLSGLSTAVLLLSLFRGKSPALITSDGKSYYAWARSVVVDGDICFDNDFRVLYPPDPLPPEMNERTPAGYVPNKCSTGMALLETPGLAAAHAAAICLPGLEADGISAPYQLAVAFSLAALYIFSLHLLYRAMICFGAARSWALVFSGAMFLGTNLVHYAAKEPAMTHGAGVALFSITLFFISPRHGADRRISPRSIWMAGILLGLLFLVRNANILMFLPVTALVWYQHRTPGRSLLRFIPAFLAVAVIQPAAIYLLWGEFRLTGYAGEGCTSGFGGMVKTLFSSRHGLFVYHPWYIFLVVTVACAVFVKKLRVPALAVLAHFTLLTAGNGSWWCWWFGDGFGNRAFIETLPGLSVVSALLFTSEGRRRAAIIAGSCVLAVCLLNLYLWAGYLLHRYPHDGNHTVAEVYFWPLK